MDGSNRSQKSEEKRLWSVFMEGAVSLVMSISFDLGKTTVGFFTIRL